MTAARLTLALLLGAACAPSAARAQEAARVPAPLVFRDARGLPRTLADFGPRRAYALVFVTRRCPIAARYLPEVQRLAGEYEPRGVQFLVVDVDPEDDLLATAAWALDRDLAVPIVVDRDRRAADALGITASPEVALLGPDRALRYRGRIDDRIRLGGAREAPTRADLRLALDEVLSGAPVSLPETPVDGCRLTRAPSPAPAPGLTYARDVAPLLARHCLECHGPGGPSGIPLASYEDVWPLGDMVAEVVRDRRMPPWHASGGPAPFANHRGLSPAERRTILDWVALGQPEGDPADLPAPPPAPSSRWSIGTPDLVVEMPRPIEVPADGTLPYQYVMLPHRFEHDTWVDRIELVAERPEVMHHANLFFLLPGRPFDASQVVAGKVPGGAPLRLPPGVAVRIPRGARLGLQLHYQPSGTAVRDRVAVGLGFPRAPVQQQLRSALIEERGLEIPPGAPHHRVEASHTFAEEVVLAGLFCHMHLRGKDATFRVALPGGEPATLLQIPTYSFDWQAAYTLRQPRRLPPGARIDVVAHFDNSRFNPYNPDPAATVRFGLQTTSEMLYCVVYYLLADERLEQRVDPRSGAPLP